MLARNFYRSLPFLKAKVIESTKKPTYPVGEIGLDAFGNKPKFVDKGKIKKIILGIGRQDANPYDIIP